LGASNLTQPNKNHFLQIKSGVIVSSKEKAGSVGLKPTPPPLAGIAME